MPARKSGCYSSSPEAVSTTEVCGIMIVISMTFFLSDDVLVPSVMQWPPVSTPIFECEND